MAYISTSKADQFFSQFIRLRDGECVRCGSPVRLNEKGLPVSHTNSHYFGRGRESTRFLPSNCDTLCMACHRIWGSEDKEAYRQFKLSQLGEDGFQELYETSRQLKKRNRKVEEIKWKRVVQDLLNTPLESKTDSKTAPTK